MYPIPLFSRRTIILFVLFTSLMSFPVFGGDPTLSINALQCMDCQNNCNVQYPPPRGPNATIAWDNCMSDCSKAFSECPPVTITPSPKPTIKPNHIITRISILKTKEPLHVITGVIKKVTTSIVLKKPQTLTNIFPAYPPTTSTPETDGLCNDTTYANSHWTQCIFCPDPVHAGSDACDFCKGQPDSFWCGDYCKGQLGINNPHCIQPTPAPTISDFCKDHPESMACNCTIVPSLPWCPIPPVTSLGLCDDTTYANSHWTQCVFCPDPAHAGSDACDFCKGQPDSFWCGDYCKGQSGMNNPHCIQPTPAPTISNFCKDHPESMACNCTIVPSLPWCPIPTVTSLGLCDDSSYAKSHWTQCIFCKDPANSGALACTLCKGSPDIMMCGDYCKEKGNPNCIVTPTPIRNSLYPKAILNPCQTLSYANSHPDECLLKVALPIIPKPTSNFQIATPIETKVSELSIGDNIGTDLYKGGNSGSDRFVADNSGSNSLVIKSLITPAVMVNLISNNPDSRSVSDQTGSSSGFRSQIISKLVKGPSFLSNVSNTSISLNQSINLTNLSVTKTKSVKK